MKFPEYRYILCYIEFIFAKLISDASQNVEQKMQKVLSNSVHSFLHLLVKY